MLVDENIGLLAGIYHGNMLNAEVVRWNQRTGNLRVVGVGCCSQLHKKHQKTEEYFMLPCGVLPGFSRPQRQNA